jgi:rubrerythrin
MRLSLKDAIKRAIEIEEGIIKFYTDKMQETVYPGSKKFLEYLINQKKNHKRFYEEYLEKADEFEAYCNMPLDFLNYSLTDNLVIGGISAFSRIQEILIFASKQEQKIHDYYLKLSKEYEGKEIGFIWECFARESLIHKEFFEKEYERFILHET